MTTVAHDEIVSHCKCDTHTHGGLTPAAPVSARDECTRTCGVSVLQVRFPNHGVLTFRALNDDDRCSRRNRFPLQVRYPHPRRADARRSWPDVRLCIAKVVFSPADVRTPTRERGALAPRGMFSECEPDYGNPAHCRCRRGLQPHGGLTPAAPGRMCVCASRKSFFAAKHSHRNTRAGGVSPPWKTKRAAD
jgi:hypothetical protein